MKTRLSLSLSAPKTKPKNPKATAMDQQRGEMVDVANKVLENVKLMSFVNMDDQHVHSITRIREIARGIVDNKIEKVSACRDVDGLLGWTDSEDTHAGDSKSVSWTEGNVSTIVAKRAKLASTRNRSAKREKLASTRNHSAKREKLASTRKHNPSELVYGPNTVTVESKVGSLTSKKSVDVGGIQKRLFSNEVIGTTAVIGNNDGQSENLGNVIDGTLNSDNVNVHVAEELTIEAVNEGAEAFNEVWNKPVEGIMFEDVELVLEDNSSVGHGQNEMQETFNGTSELRFENGQSEVRISPVMSAVPVSVRWPADGKIDLDWVKNIMTTLVWASKKIPPSEFQSAVPITVVDELINAASSIMSKEPNCVEVDCHREDSRVVIVGDIHGQFHDLLNLFELAGLPSENQFYVFNGDYVDRGAWGIEVLLVLLAWKILMPNRVCMLRGNHETGYCTSIYGFENEVKSKFGDQGEMVYKKFLECFKELPLASVISNCVYTSHGGLFRSMKGGPLRRSKRKRVQKLELGSIEELSRINRRLIDVAEEDSSVLNDVLWSDPSNQNGLTENDDRGMGLTWGPDCTEMFLKRSKLKLVIRSHQGPDARVDQDKFGDMMSGYSMDHVGKSGKLYTLFSAPSYPQFGETKYDNEGAYAVLKAPDFGKPSFHSFKAVERPKAKPYVANHIENENRATEKDLTLIPTSHGSSASPETFPAWTNAWVEFEALGIFNPPSWTVPLADNADGAKVVQLNRAPRVEGLPLPSDLQESHKATFEYLFELVAALKHSLLSRAIEGDVQLPVGEETGENGIGGRSSEIDSKSTVKEV